MAIRKCSDCPYLERKEKVPWGHYYECTKYKTKRTYNQEACEKMRGK